MNKRMKTRNMVSIAMLAAVAVVLMLFEFPLPFLPPFYKIDASELPVIIGAFAMGPWAGVLIELLKVLLNLLMDGYKPMEIRERLQISTKEYTENLQIMRMYENAKYLF